MIHDLVPVLDDRCDSIRQRFSATAFQEKGSSRPSFGEGASEQDRLAFHRAIVQSQPKLPPSGSKAANQRAEQQTAWKQQRIDKKRVCDAREHVGSR